MELNVLQEYFGEAEIGTKMADNTDKRMIVKGTSKDEEVEKRKELIKKMLMNWKVVMTGEKK